MIAQVITLAAGERVVLRDPLPSDADSFLRWQISGEWRWLDAPWEGVRSSMAPEEAETLRQRWLAFCQDEPVVPRQRAMIVTKEGKPLGKVTRYAKEDYPDVWYVGIDISEDDYLGRGFGTEVLGLWIDYLFSHSEIWKLGLDTWSFNPRMMRVAEKVGFVYEGTERELREWQGQRLDFVHYGLLRREWLARQDRGG